MRFAVLGGSNGGFASSCHLTLQGHEVNLFEPPQFYENIRQIMKLGGINLEVNEKLTGVSDLDSSKNGFIKINKITTNIKDAIEKTDAIIVVVPSFGHELFANILAPHIEDGQIIVLFTGNPGGALSFANFIKKRGIKKDIIIAETQTLVYSTGKKNPITIRIGGYKNGSFKIAAFPATENRKVLNLFKGSYKNFISATNILETGLSNQNTILHVPIMLFNAGLIEETKGNFKFNQYVTPAIARVMDALDSDRLELGKVMEIKMEPMLDILIRWYGANLDPPINLGKSFDSFCKRNPAYNAHAPKSLNHKFINEDVPFGLVPMAYLGNIFKVNMPTVNLMTNLACIMTNIDFWKKGRNLDEMGIDGMKKENILKLVNEGKPLG